MTTEEANEYLANLKGKQSEESKEPVNQEISEEVKAAPASNSDKEIGEEPKTETPAETKGDDKPKEEQLKYDLEEDARRVASCYPDDKERKEYEDLIAKNGAAFYEAVTEVDKDQVVFNYLSTMPEYPIVMKELMTNNAVLSRLFRSTDKDSLKKNIEKIADEIIEKHHAKPDKPVEQKPSIPVIGKQISNNTSSVPAVKDSSYWNNYLRQHPRG